MNTENNYVETDLGNISPNPCGEYNQSMQYEYLDLVNYQGGSYLCTVELENKITGIAPVQGKNTECWQLVTLPGDLTPEYIAMHDDVVNKAKQVEASTAAAELARQEAELALADVEQLHSDTVSAANRAAESRDSAAGYAQTAEVARDKVKESEENVNAQVTGFDIRVVEKTQESEQAIADARQQAVQTITKQQELSVQAVKDETAEYIEEQKNTAKEEINSHADEKIEEINQAYKPLDEKVELLNEDVDTLKNDTKELNDKKITKFYTSNQGETHITDSGNGKISDMRVYGRSKQKQYRGKNLLPTTMYANSTVQNGIQFINNRDGSVTVSGTATDITYFKLWGYNELSDKGILPGLKVGDTVFVSDCILQETNSKKVLKTTTNSAVTINSSTTTMFVGIKINKNTTVNKTYYPQIEKGSEATSYEPYVGGHPSPSLDYPQEIKSVVNPMVNVRGANVFKPVFKKVNSGISLEEKAHNIRFYGTFTNTYSYFELNKYVIKKGTKVTLYMSNDNDHGYFVWFKTVADEKIRTLNKERKSMTLDADCVISRFGIENYTVGDTIDFTSTIGVITDTDIYEPYCEQTVTFPYTLNAIPVEFDGNYTDVNGQQYIADYVDIENKKLIRKVGDVTFNGKEYWVEEACTLGLRYYCNIKNAKESAVNVSNNSLNSASILGTSGSTYNTPNLYTISKQNIYVSWNRTETLKEFKAKLQDTPMRVIYELANPEEIDLTDEELEAFKKLETYYPVTNVSTTSEKLDGYTIFNYPVSLENGWNYVKQQLGDNRDYIYNIDNRAQEIDMQSAEAYVNSEYAVALTELEVM